MIYSDVKEVRHIRLDVKRQIIPSPIRITEPKTDEFVERLWEAWAHWVKTKRGESSQGKLAQAVNDLSGLETKQEDISRWLKGKGRPSYEELPFLARALGVRRDWLAFADGPMLAGKVIPEPGQKTPKELQKGAKTQRKGSV